MRKNASLALALSALLLLACGSDAITHVRVAKSADDSTDDTQVATAPEMPRAPVEPQQAAAPPEAAEPSDELHWTLPAGWTAKRETGMRFATLKPPIGKLEVSVVLLQGPAGGALANVNRWRGQLGLPPIDDAQLEKLRKPMVTDAGELALFDLLSDGNEKSRTLAAVLSTKSGNSWFLKLTGGDEAVRARQPEFLRLLSSLRLGDGSGGQPR